MPDIRLGTLWNVLDADVDLGFVIIGVLGSILVTWSNYVGIKTATLVQTIVTILIILSGLLLIGGAGLSGDSSNIQNFSEPAVTGILVVLIMVPGMLIGFDVIPQSAEEINLPPKKIGLLLIVSVMCAVLWYVAISASVGLALPSQEVSSSSMATADAAASSISSASTSARRDLIAPDGTFSSLLPLDRAASAALPRAAAERATGPLRQRLVCRVALSLIHI